MSMTTQFEISKSDVVSRAVALLIPLAQEAAAAGIVIQDFERGLFNGLLTVGGKLMDAFLEAQGNGDQGENFSHEGQALHRSEEPAHRPLRTIFGRHQFEQFIYRACSDVKSEIVLRPVDQRLGLSTDRYSPLLQEFSMLFCCEQSFHGSVAAVDQVFGQRLSVDTLEKISRRMAAEGEKFLQTLPAPASSEDEHHRRVGFSKRIIARRISGVQR